MGSGYDRREEAWGSPIFRGISAGYFQLPEGVTKEHTFVGIGGPGCFDSIWEDPKFVEIEGKTCIQLHRDDILDKWKTYSFSAYHLGTTEIGVLVEPLRKSKR
jgi:hypothetical protein